MTLSLKDITLSIGAYNMNDRISYYTEFTLQAWTNCKPILLSLRKHYLSFFWHSETISGTEKNTEILETRKKNNYLFQKSYEENTYSSF